MAHLLEQTPLGTWRFVGNAPGWHGLGKVVTTGLTASEALKEADMHDWNIRTRPVYVEEDGNYVRIESMQGVVRGPQGTPDPIWAVGSQWTPFQNEQWAEFANELLTLGDEHPQVTAAGSIKGGRQTFMTLELPKHIVVGDGDRTIPYLVVINNNDGFGSLILKRTFVRVVCANTVDYCLAQGGDTFRVQHSRTNQILDMHDQAAEALQLSYDIVGKVEQEAERRIAQKVTDKRFDEIVAGLFPIRDDAKPYIKKRKEEQRDKLQHLYHEAPTQVPIKGTGWGVLNAVAEFADWEQPIPAVAKNPQRLAWSQVNFESTGNMLKKRALNLLGPAPKRPVSA